MFFALSFRRYLYHNRALPSLYLFLLEPRMLKRLAGGYSFRGIIDKDLLEEVEELVVSYDFLFTF
jgi:hypothetical protein